MSAEIDQEDVSIFEDRLWHHKGWEARIIKNEDDDGWAVSMTQDGQAEPALVGPWTMGRDKKNPTGSLPLTRRLRRPMRFARWAFNAVAPAA